MNDERERACKTTPRQRDGKYHYEFRIRHSYINGNISSISRSGEGKVESETGAIVKI